MNDKSLAPYSCLKKDMLIQCPGYRWQLIHTLCTWTIIKAFPSEIWGCFGWSLLESLYNIGRCLQVYLECCLLANTIYMTSDVAACLGVKPLNPAACASPSCSYIGRRTTLLLFSDVPLIIPVLLPSSISRFRIKTNKSVSCVNRSTSFPGVVTTVMPWSIINVSTSSCVLTETVVLVFTSCFGAVTIGCFWNW